MSEYQLPKFLLFGASIIQFAFNQYPYDYDNASSICSPEEYDPDQAQFALGSQLTHIYTRRLDVLHRGYSGFNSEQARVMLPKLLHYYHDTKPEAERVMIGIIYFGVNDSVNKGPSSVALPRYLENMRFLINEYKKRGIRCICLTTGVYDLDKAKKMFPEKYEAGIYRTNERSQEYAEGLVELCQREDVGYVNIFELFETNGGIANVCDNHHFNGKGYKLVYDKIMEVIDEKYPECKPEALKFKFPQYYENDITEKCLAYE